MFISAFNASISLMLEMIDFILMNEVNNVRFSGILLLFEYEKKRSEREKAEILLNNKKKKNESKLEKW